MEEVFRIALDLSPQERSAYLDEACADSCFIKKEVVSLLAAHEDSPAFLEPSCGAGGGVEQDGVFGDSVEEGEGFWVIGDFKLTRLIGRGGMGMVYESQQVSLNRKVAVKVLLGYLSLSRETVMRFRREAEAGARLNHPGIVAVHATGMEGGTYYIAMEFVEGVPLDAHVRDNNLSLKERLGLFVRICDAVQHAHDHGVIHRDLKPSNILVDEQGNSRILDFGLAKLTGPDAAFSTEATASGQIMGTLRYMSPEQALGHPDQIDELSDIYSLGVILYELTTGRHPYDVDEIVSNAVTAICSKEPLRPGLVDPLLRGDLETIVLKVLAKDKAGRYQSVDALSDDVQHYLAGKAIVARSCTRLRRCRQKLAGSSRRLFAVFLVVVAIMGGIWWAVALERSTRDREVIDTRRHALFFQRNLELGRVMAMVDNTGGLLAENPNLPEACLVWVQSQIRMAKLGGNDVIAREPVAVLQQKIEEGRSAWVYRTMLAEIWKGTPDGEEMRVAAEREAPDTADTWYLRSFTTFHLSEAIDFAEEAVLRDPDMALAWERLVYLYLQYGSGSETLRAIDELLRLIGDRVDILRLKVCVLTEVFEYQAAFDLNSRLFELQPGTSQPYRRRASMYLCWKMYDKALADLNMAVHLAEDKTWELRLRATLLWMTGRFKEADRDLRAFRELREYPDYADGRRNLLLREYADQLRMNGREREAVDADSDAQAALEIGRDLVIEGGWLGMIFSCLAGELPPEALIEAAGEDEEKFCEALYYAGEVFRLNGRDDDAIDSFQKCVATGLVFDPNQFPLEPMSEYHLARWRLRQHSGQTSRRP